MTDDPSDFLIQSAALLAKDLLNENKLLTITAPSIFAKDADSDDDLDLFFYSQLMKKRKVSDQSPSRTGFSSKHGIRSLAKRRPTAGNVSRTAQGAPKKHLFLKFLQECEDNTFENQYKISRSTFKSLVRLLTPNIELQNKKESIPLSTTSLILIALWLLTSQESIKSTADRFNVSEHLCRLAFNRLRDTIKLNKGFFISWPNKERAKKITEEFNEYLVYDNKLPNICGVIGCVEIPIPSPMDRSSKTGKVVKLQCVCDAKGEFLDSFVADETQVAVSNVSVFNESIKSRIESDELYIAPNCHLIGDKSYPIKRYLMVPFKEFRKTHEQNEFNMHLELSRKIIDIAIKRLFERFTCLKNLEIREATDYIELCCAMHNFCIQQNDSFYLDIGEDDTTVVSSTNTCHDFTIDQRALDKRNAIVAKFSK
ncbi:putative nuclease HARBI1 isoform X1 [Bradysia coprophila]|uniref:putative nuclease HARBI1 isoform X1 n=1 Tax=Bradysia coprophila TaxID=38358 RepID=UPI00187D83D0|nr:putative nuclease HARBI1 isoform X1 [Bradysia coprophila]